MIVVDAGDGPLPVDTVDAGDSASPSSDTYDSLFHMISQPATGVVTPSFTPVDTTEVITHQPGLMLVVRAGGDTTQAIVTIPGSQPYTGIARDDLIQAGIQNADRVFYLPALLVDPATETITVSYAQTTGVFAALLKVN